jgi:hypothetical protein
MGNYDSITDEIKGMYEQLTFEQINDLNYFLDLYWRKYHGEYIFNCEYYWLDTKEQNKEQRRDKQDEFVLKKIKQWFKLMDIDKYNKYRKISLMSLDD